MPLFPLLIYEDDDDNDDDDDDDDDESTRTPQISHIVHLHTGCSRQQRRPYTLLLPAAPRPAPGSSRRLPGQRPVAAGGSPTSAREQPAAPRPAPGSSRRLPGQRPGAAGGSPASAREQPAAPRPAPGSSRRLRGNLPRSPSRPVGPDYRSASIRRILHVRRLMWMSNAIGSDVPGWRNRQ